MHVHVYTDEKRNTSRWGTSAKTSSKGKFIVLVQRMASLETREATSAANLYYGH